jgi:hypothetical protein
MIRRSHVAYVLLVLVVTGAAASACGSPPAVKHSLSYSVAPADGGLLATVSDSRTGRHTVVVVLLSPVNEWFAALNDDGKTGVTKAHWKLPAGTYSYAVYDVEGIVFGADKKYRTPEFRIDSGEVMVP